ncbi:MAG: aspartate aminotransferase family protein, partial [Trueperaceae bacterium]
PETGAPFVRAGYAYAVGRVAMDLGLVVYPGTGSHDGVHGDHLLVGPPFSTTDAEADELVEKLEKALGAARGQMGAFREL